MICSQLLLNKKMQLSYFSSLFPLRFYGFFAVVLFALCSSCEGVIKLPANLTIPAVFFYGDSNFDQGNNNVRVTITQSNHPPYGRDFECGLATGRFNNGKTLPDLIAEELGITNLIPAYLDSNLKIEDLLTGVSFASGGSGFDSISPTIVNAIPMLGQLDYFKEYQGKLNDAAGEERANFTLNNSLHFVLAGMNDLTAFYLTEIRRSQYINVSSYNDFVVASASSFVEKLYNYGGRRIAVLALPPIGCFPYHRTLDGGPTRVCVESYNQAARLFNVKLSSALHSLSQRLPQSRIIFFDTYTPLYDLFQHPRNYGFKISDRACCGTGLIEVAGTCNNSVGSCSNDDKYTFWDSFHLTQKACQFLVDRIVPKYINHFK